MKHWLHNVLLCHLTLRWKGLTIYQEKKKDKSGKKALLACCLVTYGSIHTSQELLLLTNTWNTERFYTNAWICKYQGQNCHFIHLLLGAIAWSRGDAACNLASCISGVLLLSSPAQATAKTVGAKCCKKVMSVLCKRREVTNLVKTTLGELYDFPLYF